MRIFFRFLNGLYADLRYLWYIGGLAAPYGNVLLARECGMRELTALRRCADENDVCTLTISN